MTLTFFEPIITRIANNVAKIRDFEVQVSTKFLTLELVNMSPASIYSRVNGLATQGAEVVTADSLALDGRK
jgi:hypothetical protein